jgi:hypothetical protein
MAVNAAVRCYSDTDVFQFWLPFVSAPQRLVPGSCVAARLWARVRFRGGDRLTLSDGVMAGRGFPLESVALLRGGSVTGTAIGLAIALSEHGRGKAGRH